MKKSDLRGGMLFSQMRPAASWAADFHDWYDHEHIPARMEIPGFTGAVRYEQQESDHFLAVYHLSDMDTLKTPAYRKLKEEPSERTAWMLANVTLFTRYTADLVFDTAAAPLAPSPMLFVVAFDAPEDRVAELDDWYENEHIPLLMKVPGWQRVRRYAARPDQAGGKVTRFALHEISGPSALAAPEREAARNTDWRARLAREPWFEANQRWIYRQRQAFSPVS